MAGRVMEEAIIEIWRTVVLIAVLALIILIVSGFYSKQYDVREIEANMIASKFADCLMNEQGVVSEADVNNFADLCGLKLDLEEHYVSINLENEGSISNSFGKDALKVLCETKVKQKYYPFCITKNYLAFEESDEGDLIPAELKIFVAILKTEKNV